MQTHPDRDYAHAYADGILAAIKRTSAEYDAAYLLGYADAVLLMEDINTNGVRYE